MTTSSSPGEEGGLSASASGEKAFPWVAMSFLSLGMLAHSVVFTSPLPYVAFMVVDFHMVDNVDTAGYTAGWITGMFMIGRTVSGIPWGLAADRFGRRWCLVISMVNIAVFGLIFGLSKSFAIAVSMRLLTGLGNGFMAVAKTTVTEITANKEHELQAFGILNGVWGLGMIVGPAIGGFLARPAVLYPHTFSHTGVWGRYPYLLPSVVCSSIALVAGAGTFLWVQETLVKDYERLPGDGAHDIELVDLEASDRKLLGSDEDHHVADNGENVKASIDDSCVDSSPTVEGDGDSDRMLTNGEALETSTSPVHLPNSFSEIIHSPSIRVLFAFYLCTCFCVLMTDEAFPLWAVTSVRNGGLSWESTQVGEMLGSVGLGLIVFQIFLFKAAMTRCCFPDDPVRTYSRCLWLMALFLCVMPFVADAAMRTAEHRLQTLTADAAVGYSDNGVDTRRDMGLRLSLVLCFLAYRLPSTVVFTTLAVLVNSSVDRSMRGTMNGLIMTAGSLGNALGPILGSMMYAGAIKATYPHPDAPHHRSALPVDGRGVFLATGALAVGLAVLSRKVLSSPPQ